jgi:hypothetical protein
VLAIAVPLMGLTGAGIGDFVHPMGLSSGAGNDACWFVIGVTILPQAFRAGTDVRLSQRFTGILRFGKTIGLHTLLSLLALFYSKYSKMRGESGKRVEIFLPIANKPDNPKGNSFPISEPGLELSPPARRKRRGRVNSDKDRMPLVS